MKEDKNSAHLHRSAHQLQKAHMRHNHISKIIYVDKQKFESIKGSFENIDSLLYFYRHFYTDMNVKWNVVVKHIISNEEL